MASTRPDGSLRPYLTVWAVRAGDELYVRSAYGYSNPWFRRAHAIGKGRIQPVTWNEMSPSPRPTPMTTPPIDAAYHAKYDRYGRATVGSVTGADAEVVTSRLQHRGDS